MIFETIRKEPELKKILISVASISTGAFTGNLTAERLNVVGVSRFPFSLAGALTGAVISHYIKKRIR